MKSTLKKEARAAADLFEAQADALENSQPGPLELNPTATRFVLCTDHWEGGRYVQPYQQEITVTRYQISTWQTLPEPDSLRKAAALLRRAAPLARAKCPTPPLWVDDPTDPGTGWTKNWSARHGRRSPDVSDCIAAAVAVYGQARAGEVLRRHLATIEPADYHPRAVATWKRAAELLEACGTKNQAA